MTAPAVVPDWEQAERARLDAARCPDPECRALPPNHLVRCGRIRVPDPDAKLCRTCEYPAGSLGCRFEHGSGS
jgi:hypothetical protein